MYGLACMELEYGDSGLPSFVSVQGSLAMFPIWGYGAEEHKQEWLPRMAAGEAIGCFGLTEPDAGLDRVLLAPGQAGEWLNRADSLDAMLTTRAVAYETEKSQLEDLDLIKGISDFQNQQLGLEAALKSYAQVQRLSLFEFVR